MSSEKLKIIAQHHDTVWRGAPWHGSNCVDGLKGVTAAQSTMRFAGQHNMAEVLFHMCQWKRFVLEKVKGNALFNVKFRSTEDWKQIDELDEVSWAQMVEEFNELSKSLIEEITVHEDSLLIDQVPGRSYPYSSLLEGITEHDIYHLGQILLLKKMAQHEI